MIDPTLAAASPLPDSARPSLADVAAATEVRLRTDRVVLRPHADGLLVYEFMIGGFYVLNRAARLIVEMIGDNLTVSDIAERVDAASGEAISADDVVELLADLAEIHVVELLEVGRS